MPTIYAAATDGGIKSFGPDDEVWNDVHDNNGGSHVFAVATGADTILYGPTVTFDGTNYNIYRTFFAFDVSGVSSAPASAQFKFKTNTYSNGDIIAVKATKPDTSTNLVSANFNELTGWQSGFNNTHLTAYSAKISGAGSGTALHTITLNSTALSDMGSNSTLSLCLMNYDHDYLDSAPGASLGVTQRFGMYFADSSGTGNDPYIEYVVGGFTHQVSGLASSNIDSIIGVPNANIESRSGVNK